MSLPTAERAPTALGAYVGWVADHPRGFLSLMARGPGIAEIASGLEEARWEGITRIAEAADVDLDSPPARPALRGWVGFVEGALLAWVEDPALEQDQLVQMLLGALTATIVHLQGER